MRVLVQWARGQASGWEEFDSAHWNLLPDNGPPGRDSAVSGARGWIAAVCVQGTVFCADRLAVVPIKDDGIRVYAAHDDSATSGPGGPFTRVVDFAPLGPDPDMGQAINTRIRARVLSGDARALSGLPFRDGILLPNALWEEHRQAQESRSWREWAEGVDAGMVRRGRVVGQRRLGRYRVPVGTRTYYLDSTVLATGAHVAHNEVAMLNIPTGATNVESTDITVTGEMVLTASSPVGEPDSAAWPTGDYRCQLDVASVNADIEYGLLDLGTQGDGHFGRVGSGLASDLESHPQQEGAFQFAGLKLATTGSVSWSAGTSSDRFEVLVAARRPTGHGAATITLELGELDDFADGPWTAAAVGDSAPLVGVNF